MMQAVLYNIPVLGWMLREAVEGNATAKLLFIINLLLFWALMIVLFGLPALILPALCAVPVILTMLVILSWPYTRD